MPKNLSESVFDNHIITRMSDNSMTMKSGQTFTVIRNQQGTYIDGIRVIASEIITTVRGTSRVNFTVYFIDGVLSDDDTSTRLVTPQSARQHLDHLLAEDLALTERPDGGDHLGRVA